MSVLIKGMEMPENCDECPFNYDLMECMAASHKIRLNYERRPKECPIIEVPTPHGRLIDAEKLEGVLIKEKTELENLSNLLKEINYMSYVSYMSQAFGVNKAKLWAEFQPVIIEAEGEEEDV